MIISNYHTHSLFCKHAKNTLEELVRLAIKHNYEYFGISEHIPVNGGDERYRLSVADEPRYLDEMNMLKKKYADKIKLYAGYEADIINSITGEDILMQSIARLNNTSVDYLLLANHTYKNHGHTYVKVPTLEEAKEWINDTKRAWMTGKFKFMVHPDGFANAYVDREWDDAAYYMADELTKFAAKENMPLGINVNGIYEGKGYPSLKFLKIAAKNGAKAIIELDAHNEKPFAKKIIKKAMDMVEQSGIKLIDKINI